MTDAAKFIITLNTNWPSSGSSSIFTASKFQWPHSTWNYLQASLLKLFCLLGVTYFIPSIMYKNKYWYQCRNTWENKHIQQASTHKMLNKKQATQSVIYQTLLPVWKRSWYIGQYITVINYGTWNQKLLTIVCVMFQTSEHGDS